MSKVNVGDKFNTKQGCVAEVIEYTSYNKIRIKFLDYAGHEMTTAGKELKSGSVKNPYYPFVRGVGFVGVGPYSCAKSQEYRHWSGMLARCYTDSYQSRFPTYKGCSVDTQWHNYQEFAEWCQWQVGFGGGVLDKDILVRGNKVYSPETCVFVPKEINGLIVCPTRVGKQEPAGISFQTSSQKYIVSCAVGGKNKNLGRYSCPEQAFRVYKDFKENLVKERAEALKDKLDVRAYTALMNFEVKDEQFI